MTVDNLPYTRKMVLTFNSVDMKVAFLSNKVQQSQIRSLELNVRLAWLNANMQIWLSWLNQINTSLREYYNDNLYEITAVD